MTEFKIRKARPQEGDTLRRICLESKRSWGYSDEFMARFAREIIVDPKSIARDQVFVASLDTDVVGWLRVLTDREPAVLDDLWVTPKVFGRGVGRKLFAQAVSVVRGTGAVGFELDADPNAQEFYEHMGCVKVGETLTSMGRYIPRMRYDLV